MITAAGPRVWSTAFFTSGARYLAVGAGTGSLVGVVLGGLSVVVGASSLAYGGVAIGGAALAGAALSLPAAVVGAATGLVAAVRRPASGWLVLLGLLWCPALLVVWLAWLWMSLGGHGWPQQLTAVLLAEAVVVGAVVSTWRWVVAPVRHPTRLDG